MTQSKEQNESLVTGPEGMEIYEFPDDSKQSSKGNSVNYNGTQGNDK